MIEKHLGNLSKGCKSCFKGKKLVLFTTGICPKKCIYCPLSEEKKNKDVIYANEVKVKNFSEIIKEVKNSGAIGAGITGGDPLSKIERTIKFISALKKNFGRGFHIHLYTSLDLITPKIIRRLQKAELDELRVHLDLENKRLWKKLKLIFGKFKETGIEIPVIPRKEKKIIEMINQTKKFVNFFNLNELEYATLYEKEYKKRGWKIRTDYSVEGSEKSALKIIKYFKKKKEHIRIHYCSSRFKDNIQLKKRIKNTAKAVAKKFDFITEEGMLLRGAIYLEETKPVFESKIKKPKNFLNQLKKLKKELNRKFPKEIFEIDADKVRILCSIKNSKIASKKFKNCTIVEEYPSVDKTQVYLEYLS